jgi:hypothetical protein
MYKRISEQRQPQGSQIIYECTNDGRWSYLVGGHRNREKVFEGR